MRWWPAGGLGSCSWGRGRHLGRSGGNNGDDRRRRGSVRGQLGGVRSEIKDDPASQSSTQSC